MKTQIIIFLLIVKSTLVSAQFVQIEATTGFYKSGITQVSSLAIEKEAKTYLNVLAFFQKYHLQESYFLDEAGLQLSVLRKLIKDFSIGPTIYYNSIAGLMNNATIGYANVKKKYLLIINSSVGYSSKQKSLLGEFFIQGEYKIEIPKQWYVISYVQVLTNWIKLKSHNRSFQKVRLGLSKNSWQFGIGLDFDQYGSDPIRRNTYGIFIRK